MRYMLINPSYGIKVKWRRKYSPSTTRHQKARPEKKKLGYSKRNPMIRNCCAFPSKISIFN